MVYVPLRIQSEFSFGEGASKLKALIKKLAKEGYPAAALTDTNNMHGYLEWSLSGSDVGLQTLVGSLVTVVNGDVSGELLFLVKNDVGFKNLCEIQRLSYLHSPKDEAQIQFSEIFPYLDGLVCLSGDFDNGFIAKHLLKGMETEAVRCVKSLTYAMGEDFFIEICRREKKTEKDSIIEDAMLGISEGLGDIATKDGGIITQIPIVGTTKILYADISSQDAYIIVQTKKAEKPLVIGENGLLGDRENLAIPTMERAEEMFADLPDAISNTVTISKRCSWKGQVRKPILPPYQTDRGEVEELRHQAHEGLKRRIREGSIDGSKYEEYKTRLDYELGVIIKMGFPGYFLIVADFINWAKDNDIPVGPGRGSGAGSLVAYSLRITNLDPLPYGLLFERFLNPERVSMPDFDIDFCAEGRERVVEYVRGKYGKECVSLIATYGQLKSKNALKDVGRFMTHEEHGIFSFYEMNMLTRLIPGKVDAKAEPMGLLEAYENSPPFREIIDGSPKYKALYDYARNIEGLYHSRGSHAAGVVIGAGALTDFIPVIVDKNGANVAQLNMKYVEMAGMVKFDFLGLQNLTTMKLARDYIERDFGVRIDPDLLKPDDPAVYENIFAKAFTNGVFQVEGGGMKKELKNMKPQNFADIIALVALYRPGPMDNIPTYNRVKHGLEEAKYPEPVHKTKPILEETNGIMVYQEQVMQVAQAVAGYTMGGADLLRRAMGKKNKEEMEKERAKFAEGAASQGIDKKTAAELFDDINKFAGYGFNKSHAAVYAYIAYQTAWFKYYFPVQYYAALMSHTDKPERIFALREEMENVGCPLLMPSANHSFSNFAPEIVDGEGYQMQRWPSNIDPPKFGMDKAYGVRFGLGAIKALSQTAGDQIAAARNNGKFKSLEDFYHRVGNEFDSRKLERMNEAGVFDEFLPCDTRGTANRHGGLRALQYLQKGTKALNKKPGQVDLFANELAQIPKDIYLVADWNDRPVKEFNAVGFYFNAHPIDAYVDRLKTAGVARLNSIQEWMTERGVTYKRHKICVMVDDVKVRTSQRGNNYIFVFASEKANSYTLMVTDSQKSAQTLREKQNILENAKQSKMPVIIEADISIDLERDGECTVFAKEIVTVTNFIEDLRGEFHIVFDASKYLLNRLQRKSKDEGKDVTEDIIQQMKNTVYQVLSENEAEKGSNIFVTFKNGDEVYDVLEYPKTVKFSSSLQSQFQSMNGISSMTERVLTPEVLRQRKADLDAELAEKRQQSGVRLFGRSGHQENFAKSVPLPNAEKDTAEVWEMPKHPGM